MKINRYFNKSLSKRVVFLMGACIIFFMIGTIILAFVQHQLNQKYIEERSEIVFQRNVLMDIYDQFNTVFIGMTGMATNHNPQLKDGVLSKEADIQKLTEELQKASDNLDSKTSISKEIDQFRTFYFEQTLSPIIEAYENGDTQKMSELTNENVMMKVDRFRKLMKDSISLNEEQLEENVRLLEKKQSYIQISFLLLTLFFVILLQRAIKVIFRNIGKPLSDFTFAANEIAAGREAVISVDSDRNDELSALAFAFKEMIVSVQSKEQDLVAHNEELLAQQDELQAGQNELQETLGILIEKEEKLIRRNDLIKGISTSLNKEEVLQSIVVNMCRITFSDRGLIALIHEDSSASFGISPYGVQQFKKNIHSGLNQRLLDTKKAFTIKREQDRAEKGFHETISYCYDLYLPVLTSFQDVEAIMVYSRYSQPFNEKEMEEYEIFAKQIGISLEKIKLYEQSEAERVLNQDILNTVQEGIQLIDKNRVIIQVNQQLCEMFGVTSIDKMLGLSWGDWSSIMADQMEDEEFLIALEQAIDSASSNGKKDSVSFTYHKKKDNRVVQVYCKTLNNGEEEMGTILVHRDITKQYEVDQMKSEFVSTVSHELRTPLASVLGFTELMLHKELKPERKTKYLQTIYNEAKRLSSLINDFLDVQRMESGKQTYEKKFLDIRPIMERVIENQQISTVNHQIHLSVETEQTRILGDKEKIEQVFTNLLGNAIKYSPDGGNIYIHIHDHQEWTTIDVQDEGLGIPKEALPHLFQKFYRVDNSDHRGIGGTGLGLSIVEEIVKAHGGCITVDSEYGKGSTFTLIFPKVVMEEEKEQNLAKPELRYHILVVEDDLSLAELLKNELLESGFHVFCVHKGSEALRHIQKSPPDAIVLDIMLEEDEIDGWKIMKELKSNEQLKNIPIFVSTALDEKEQGFSLGAQEYLVKPYRPSELSKVIMHTLLKNGKQGQIMIPKGK